MGRSIVAGRVHGRGLAMLLLLLVGVLFWGGCYYARHVMTLSDYLGVESGVDVSTLLKQYGPPQKIHSAQGAQEIYEYTEKISIDQRVAEVKHYFFVIAAGQVVDKYHRTSRSSLCELIYAHEPP